MINLQPKILVIVVLYNGARWLDKCCQAIKESTINLEPFFIDNKSSDSSVDIVKSHFPNCKIILSDKNLGFGKANNIGFRHALQHDYDYVFLLNQDAYIAADMMEKLLKAIPYMDSPGIISPIQLKGDATGVDEHFKSCIYYTVCPGLLEDAVRQSMKIAYKTYMGHAAAWLLPVSTLKQIGGFDPIFYHYGEDVHYVSRVLYHGLDIYIVPNSFVCHDRKFAGNEESYRKDILFRELKNSYLDLNRKNDFWSIKLQSRYLYRIAQSLLTLHWDYVAKSIMAYLQIFFHRKEYKKNIKKNMQCGANWL